MNETKLKLDLTSALEIVDHTLLLMLAHINQQMQDILPENEAETWTYSAEELRTSPFGEALLLIAHCASGNGLIEKEQVQRSMQYVCRMLYGDDVRTLPARFYKTEPGRLFSSASVQIYSEDDLMTPVQVYRMLGIARQSLYDRLASGKLTPVYGFHELRFQCSEIEAWKAQREQRDRKE